MHTVGKLVLAIGRKSQFFPMWTPFTEWLDCPHDMAVSFPRVGAQRKKLQCLLWPNPGSQLPVLTMSYWLYWSALLKVEGDYTGACVWGGNNLWDLPGAGCHNYTYSPSARSVLPQISAQLILSFLPDLCSKFTLLEGAFLKFLSEWNPSHHSLSSYAVLFSLLHLEHLTVTYSFMEEFVMIKYKFHVCKI